MHTKFERHVLTHEASSVGGLTYEASTLFLLEEGAIRLDIGRHLRTRDVFHIRMEGVRSEQALCHIILEIRVAIDLKQGERRQGGNQKLDRYL